MGKQIRLFYASALFLITAAVHAGEYSFGTGVEYTEADYGSDSKTSALYIPFTLGYDANTYGWSLTVPYLSVTGTGEFAYSRTGVRQSSQDTPISTGSGPGPGGGATESVTEESTESGMGDVTLSGTYRLIQSDDGSPQLAMTAKVKFATADEKKSLGTGENDYSLQLEAELDNVYGYLGYLFIGDTARTDYDDILFGAVGFTIPRESWRYGAEYYAEQAVMDGVDPVSEVTLSAARELGKDNWLNLYFIKGFTDSSADWVTGVGITHYF